jgi:hypothetical protein
MDLLVAGAGDVHGLVGLSLELRCHDRAGLTGFLKKYTSETARPDAFISLYLAAYIIVHRYRSRLAALAFRSTPDTYGPGWKKLSDLHLASGCLGFF